MKKILIFISLLTLFFLVGCDLTFSSNVDPTTVDSTTTNSYTENKSEESITISETISDITMSDIITSTEKITYEGSPMAIGIWHRPNVMGDETNLDGIRNTLDIFSRCGINIVYLETIYHGMAVYKSNFLPYYNGFNLNSVMDSLQSQNSFSYTSIKKLIWIYKSN